MWCNSLSLCSIIFSYTLIAIIFNHTPSIHIFRSSYNHAYTISSPHSLQWRHYGRDSVSNHQPHDCLLNVYSAVDQRKRQSSVSLAFVRGIHRWPVNSPHKWPVTRKMFPFGDVIMYYVIGYLLHHGISRYMRVLLTYFITLRWFWWIEKASLVNVMRFEKPISEAILTKYLGR